MRLSRVALLVLRGPAYSQKGAPNPIDNCFEAEWKSAGIK
jgi:hypothetical protein